MQAERLQRLLAAKKEHGAALISIQACVDANALTAAEVERQKDIAMAELETAREAAGLSSAAGKEEERKNARLRGRQVGSKNTPRTGIEGLRDETLAAVCTDLGLAVATDSGRVKMLQGIHGTSGSTAKVLKTNLDGLCVDTLKLICLDKKLATPQSEEKEELISCIQAGVSMKKTLYDDTLSQQCKKSTKQKKPKHVREVSPEDFLKEIKELERKADIVRLRDGLTYFQAENRHKYGLPKIAQQASAQVLVGVCQSLLKLLTIKDHVLARSYIELLRETDSSLEEALMLTILEHGTDDVEVQDVTFAVLNVICCGNPRVAFYKFAEKRDGNAYEVLLELKYSSDARCAERIIDPAQVT